MDRVTQLQKAADDASATFQEAIRRKKEEEAKRRQMEREAQVSEGLLLANLETRLAIYVRTGEVNPQVLRLYLQRSEDPQRAFVTFVYDLLNSPTVGLLRAPEGGWVLFSETYSTFGDLLKALQGLPKSWELQETLSYTALTVLVERIANPSHPESPGVSRRTAIDAAIRNQEDPEIPGGLTLRDSIALRTAIGLDPI
ncbi:MAG: hypothetical protein AAFN18_00880 [Cyanobacteria bacterium J06554_6]